MRTGDSVTLFLLETEPDVTALLRTHVAHVGTSRSQLADLLLRKSRTDLVESSS